MPNSKLIPVQMLKGSKVVPLTPDEYALHNQAVWVNNTLTWSLSILAGTLCLTALAVRGNDTARNVAIFSALPVAIAARIASGENVRRDRIAKDWTDGSDASRQGRIFQQTSVEQVPVDAWYEALEEEETAGGDDYPDDLLCKPYDRDFIERFTLNRNSKLIVGAPGCGKTVTAKAWIATLFNYFPEAIVLVNYRKVARFCGLEALPMCCSQSKQGDLSSLFTQMALIHAIHQTRSNMDEETRKLQPPVVFYIADYAATWGNISNILGDRKHKDFSNARIFLERLGEIITVGRENNVQVVVDTQSFNLTALGNIDSNERGCLTTLGLGFESLDQWGQKSGNYEVLQLLIRNAFMVSSESDREQLTNWLPLMRGHSQETRQPLAFTSLGGSELFFLPDYRFFETYNLPNGTLETLSKNIARAYCDHQNNASDDSIFDGSVRVQNGLNRAEPGSAVQPGSETPEPLNHATGERFSGSVQGSELFTNRKLPASEARMLISLLFSEGLNQTQIIEMLWGAKKGGNKPYLQARAEFDFLTRTDFDEDSDD